MYSIIIMPAVPTAMARLLTDYTLNSELQSEACVQTTIGSHC